MLNIPFPRVKFLNKRRDLDYSDKRNSLCQHVIEHCNVPSAIDKAIWWQQNRKHVLATITLQQQGNGTQECLFW